MRAAVVQMHAEEDLEANLSTAERLVRAAAADGADVVVLPEMVDYLGDNEGVAAIKTSIPGTVSERLAAVARECGVWLLAGSIHEAIEGDHRTWNTSLLFDRNGVEQARYRKIHLYDVQIPGQVDSLESATIAPGSDIVTADIEGHTAGLAICYDLRFPELFRELMEQGAELMFLPAAFTLFTGKDHWEVLIRARAIENQCFVLASGQQGKDKHGRTTYGRSMIVDPWGTVLAVAPDGEGYAMASLDFDRLHTLRLELPSIANRRLHRAVTV